MGNKIDLQKLIETELKRRSWRKSDDNEFFLMSKERTPDYKSLAMIAENDPQRFSLMLKFHGCSNIDDLYLMQEEKSQLERTRILFQIKRIKDAIHSLYDGVIVDFEECRLSERSKFILRISFGVEVSKKEAA